MERPPVTPPPNMDMFQVKIDWQERVVEFHVTRGDLSIPKTFKVPIGVLKGCAAAIMNVEVQQNIPLDVPYEVEIRRKRIISGGGVVPSLPPHAEH